MSSEPTAPNPLKAKLAAGGCATCIMATMPSVAVAQVLAASGVDCLIIDMEHGPIDVATAHAMVAATRGTGAVPVVRVPWAEPWLAKPVLDTGAMGINFPMVSTAALARETVRAVRYPPLGVRGYAPSCAPVRWGLPPGDYLRVANDEVLNIITIEEPEAIHRLDEILAVPGIDVAVIASFDLSMAMGIPGRFDDPELVKLVAGAEAKIKRAGLPLGGVALTAEAKRAAGYRLLLVGFDVLLVDAAARAAVASVTAPP
jgi:4-hydroxy-2-oxoheptanedioate aldolase